MRSLQSLKGQKGFTIVELLIVIVVIGILATLVIITFSGIQQRARDTQRQTDINGIQGQVEAYFAETGFYPTLEMINSAAWRAEHMRGLPEDALRAPDDTVISGDAAANGHYQYEAWTVATIPATAADCSTAGTVTAATTSNCLSYRITADLEASDDNYERSNK